MSDLQYVTDTYLLMGTVVSIQAVSRTEADVVQCAIARAFDAMCFVEETCSRFNEHSALRELCRHPEQSMQVPDVLFETLRIALEMSVLTDGAFDPTIGATLEANGFNRDYLTGNVVQSDIASTEPVSYRDITLDEANHTVLLQKPMLLDLGAVAKGLAVDLAARELAECDGFAIDAGGDLYLHGVDPTGDEWTVGIQHPLEKERMICFLRATNVAVCTSGSYERKSPLKRNKHHLIHPKTGDSITGLLSCTVIAPLAILADAVSTAAFVLGADRALEFVESLELPALCISDTLDVTMTHAMERYLT